MAKIIKLKDLIKEGTWNTRKFGEPLPTMEDYKTAYNKKHSITEAEGDGYTDTTPSDNGEEEAPTVAVQPDFELIAFDFVSNPSTQGAFMSPGKMNESVNDGVGTRKGRCTHDCKIEGIINDIFRGE